MLALSTERPLKVKPGVNIASDAVLIVKFRMPRDKAAEGYIRTQTKFRYTPALSVLPYANIKA